MQTKKFTTLLATGILMSAVFAGSVSADTDIRISGNGSHSDNAVSVRNERNVSISQSNNTDISNNVSVSQNTGGNSASGNTGGDVSIQTGNATSDVSIVNKAGSNVAHIDGCCDGGDTTIKVDGNGSWSDNHVNVSKSSDLSIEQNNDTDIDNDVDVHQNTGHNSASGNTWGDVSIETGDVDSDVSIHNQAGSNVLHLNGCCEGGDTNISISGNGTGSDNRVSVNNSGNTDIDQDNNTDFDNDVNVHQNTGHNYASSDYFRKWFNHDKKYFDKKYDRDDHKKDYDHDYKKYDKDQKHDKDYKPFVKYFEYDKDHKKSYDHDKKFVDYRKNYDHKKHDFDKYDFKKYDHDYDKDKKYYPVTYIKYDNDYKKDYDRGHEKKYVVKKYHDYDHKDRDHDKKYNHGKRHDSGKYTLVKYPKFSYNHDRNDYCDSDRHGKKYQPKLSYFHPYHGGYGNTGGSVHIRTGDARSNVNLNNSGSSNVLHFM